MAGRGGRGGDGGRDDDRADGLAVSQELVEYGFQALHVAGVDLEQEAVLAGDAVALADLRGRPDQLRKPVRRPAAGRMRTNAVTVIPYVTDQLAIARLPRAAFALMLALLPAAGTAIGLLVLGQVPTWRDLLGIALVIAGVASHHNSASIGA